MAKQNKELAKKKKVVTKKPVTASAASLAFDVEVSVEFRGGTGKLKLTSMDDKGNRLETKNVLASTAEPLVFKNMNSQYDIVVTGPATGKTTITIDRETDPPTPDVIAAGNIMEDYVIQ